MKKNTPKNNHNGKLVVVLGPTASGKSNLAVILAKKFNGEIVSSDSRQVYKGLDIGTGKIKKKEMMGVPHHMLDIRSPKKVFSVVEYKKLADKIILEILSRGKTPIITGGTGQYISAIVDDLSFPEVSPNKKLRKELDEKTTLELFSILKKLDAKRANSIDKKNPHRLIRAIEIAKAIGSVPPITKINEVGPRLFNTLQIGIKTDKDELNDKIYKRVISRLKSGMLNEARNLHKKGLPWKRMEALGLEYRFLSRHLRGKMTKEEMVEQLYIAIRQYAKRQNTWWKRDNRIQWFKLSEIKRIEDELKKFLK